MSALTTDRLSRRTVIQGLGIGALGLAGAALLGCGGAKSSDASSGSGAASGSAAPASKGVGLPLTAPVVQGKEKAGGTFT